MGKKPKNKQGVQKKEADPTGAALLRLAAEVKQAEADAMDDLPIIERVYSGFDFPHHTLKLASQLHGGSPSQKTTAAQLLCHILANRPAIAGRPVSSAPDLKLSNV
jgi:hypothetical protein